MPIFEYRWKKCGYVTSFLEKSNSQQPHICEKCSSQDTKRIFSTFASRSSSSPSSSSTCPTGTCSLS